VNPRLSSLEVRLMSKLVAILATLAVAALALPASATVVGCSYSTTDAELDAAGYYVSLDKGGDLGGIWIYEESNGIGGLQRGDEVVDDTGDGCIEADGLVL
jgi:uncharacterized membrane protein